MVLLPVLRFYKIVEREAEGRCGVVVISSAIVYSVSSCRMWEFPKIGDPNIVP